MELINSYIFGHLQSDKPDLDCVLKPHKKELEKPALKKAILKPRPGRWKKNTSSSTTTLFIC
jgi:hypothetical protein